MNGWMTWFYISFHQYGYQEVFVILSVPPYYCRVPHKFARSLAVYTGNCSELDMDIDFSLDEVGHTIGQYL